MQKKRVAIISQKDTLWSLYAWNTFILTNSKYEVVGIWNCEEKLGKLKGFQIFSYYLKTFGPITFSFLAFFGVLFRLKIILSKKHKPSFKKLAEANQIPFQFIKSPNNPRFISWVKDNHIDILIIMVPHIIKTDLIEAPKLGVINKHASLLPLNKGIFPYLWAKINNTKQGVSYHLVNRGIDEGAILYQEEINSTRITRSLISFYFEIYSGFHSGLNKAISNLLEDNFQKKVNDNSNYFSFPTKTDMKQFRYNKGKIILWKDILHLFKTKL